jgi:hypothetical protein
MVDWIALGAALARLSPEKYERVVGAILRMIEGLRLVEESERLAAPPPPEASTHDSAN